MDNVQNTGELAAPTAEELKQEDEVLQDTPQQEKVRASVIEKYGLDEGTQADLIEKLTADTLEQHQKFGKVVKQKRAWREKASAAKPAEPKPAQPAAPAAQPDVNAIINERLEQEYLEDLDIPEDLKPEVQKLAKMQGISVRKAAKDPYIVHRIQDIAQQERADKAAINRTNKGSKVSFDVNNPPKVDMSTEEGRKQWDEYTKYLQSQEQG
jgi:hypothetical protein